MKFHEIRFQQGSQEPPIKKPIQTYKQTHTHTHKQKLQIQITLHIAEKMNVSTRARFVYAEYIHVHFTNTK
jgi:hypothetical protein